MNQRRDLGLLAAGAAIARAGAGALPRASEGGTKLGRGGAAGAA